MTTRDLVIAAIVVILAVVAPFLWRLGILPCSHGCYLMIEPLAGDMVVENAKTAIANLLRSEAE